MFDLRAPATVAAEPGVCWPAPALRHTPERRWPLEPVPVGAAWQNSLRLIERHVAFTRRTVAAGTRVQRVGEAFKWLHVINSGVVKLVHLAADGRALVVGLNFKGDWIGFDGIASGECACDAVSMDTCDVWSVCYATVVSAAIEVPPLLNALHVGMSLQLARERQWRMGLGTLSSEARLADFMGSWAASLAARQLRTDTISLRMTRAEIGSYLGLTHETVSRAFTRLERAGLVSFDLRGRRQITIPDLDALADFVRLRGGRNDDASSQRGDTQHHPASA